MMKYLKIFLLSLIFIISIASASAYDFNEDNNLNCLNDDFNEVLESDIILDSNLNSINLDDNSNYVSSDDCSINPDSDNGCGDSNTDYNDSSNSNQYTKSLSASNLNSPNIHKITQSNYSKIFDRNGNIISSAVAPYDIIDLSGSFNSKSFIATIPLSFTSTLSNAKLTNCMIKFDGMTASESKHASVSNLYIRNTNADCPGVFLYNSSYIDVFNNDIFCRGANGNPVRVLFSNHSSIFFNTLETNFTGYMNLSWKRAGILLGDSHYNNIYSNHVTIKDSNPIYLTTYGFEKSNYNVIFNNTVRSSAISEDTGLANPSAWAYGIHLMGDYNLALDNTIYNMYRGIDSEGSFNTLAGNIIFNLTGGYFEGNDGTEGGDYGIHASYDNIIANNTIFNSKITGSAIYLMPNNTAYGNIVYNISGKSGLEFDYYAENCHVYDNIIDVPESNAVYIFGRMNNLRIYDNILSTVNASAIIVKKQSNSKYPTNLTIFNNTVLGFSTEYNLSPIDFSEIPSDANIVSFNNSIVVYNETFFNYFDSDGIIKDCCDWNNLNNGIIYDNSYNFNSLIFKGNFADLSDNDPFNVSIDKNINLIPLNIIVGDRISNVYRKISFDEFDSLIDSLNNLYSSDTVFNNIYFVLNCSNINIDGFIFNYTGALNNGFLIEGLKNISLTNNKFYFSSDMEDYALILTNNASLSFINNLIVVDSKNYALAVDCSNASLKFNNIRINEYHAAVLDANQSKVVLEDNIMETLSGITIDCINSTYPKFSVYIIDDSNYYQFFNSDGTFRENFEIEFGNTLKLANITNKRFIIDIPLKITSMDGDYAVINSFFSLEGEASNSIVSNIEFIMNNELSDKSKSLSIISIKEGVSDVSIVNNSFSADLSLNSNSNYNNIFSPIRLFGSDYLSRNINIENNVFNISSNSTVYGLYLSNRNEFSNSKVSPRDMMILNNNFTIESSSLAKAIYLDSVENILIEGNLINVNTDIDFNTELAYAMDLNKVNNLNVSNNIITSYSNLSAYGIALKYVKNFNLLNNDISSNSTSSIAIELSNSSDFNILNNHLEVYGGYLINMAGEDIPVISDCAVFVKGEINSNLIKNNYLFLEGFNGTLKDNILIENGMVSSLIHSFNSTRDIQNLIDNANPGDIIELSNRLYSNLETIYVDRNITISGGVFLSNGKCSVLFDVESDSATYDSFNYLNVINGKYLLDSSDLLMLVKDYNGTDSLTIEVPQINISNNMIFPVDSLDDAESITVLKIVSQRAVLSPTDGVFISNNTIESGIRIFKFEVNSVLNFTDNDIDSGSLIQKKSTDLIFEDMVTTAFRYQIDGRIGEYFKVILKDENNRSLSNKTVQIALNGKIYTRTTDENGSAELQINIANSGIYTLAIYFAGDEYYNSSFAVEKLTVKKQSPKLNVSNLNYKSTVKSKTLKACLITAYGNPIKYARVSFTINGKTYSATTDSNGFASVKVSLATKKTYKFTVKFAGDSTYNAISKSAKLTVK